MLLTNLTIATVHCVQGPRETGLQQDPTNPVKHVFHLSVWFLSNQFTTQQKHKVLKYSLQSTAQLMSVLQYNKLLYSNRSLTMLQLVIIAIY